MDFQMNLDDYVSCTCIMSVETFKDGGYGNIRVVKANKIHEAVVLRETGKEFFPDSPYELSFPKDLNFEDFCYRCAIGKKQMHTYVNLYRIGLWLEMYMLPLASDKENIGYCLYSYNVTPKQDENSMSDLSPDISSAILSTCIKLRGESEFGQSMNAVIKDIRDICDATRCCVIELDKENATCSVIADASKPGFPSFLRTSEVRREFYKIVATWEETLAGSTCIIIKNEQDMKVLQERNPVWYTSLREHNVSSLVLFPLRYNTVIVGYIWATNFETENALRIKEVLELTTFFLASEIANYQLLQKLEHMSTIDMLTGTLNRNAMNLRVDEFSRRDYSEIKSLGVIFADLNGLKKINDTNGHNAGDELLKNAAHFLKQVFEDDEIYRAGGDEFMIIAVDILEEEFEFKVDRLRNLDDKGTGVSFAIGACFEDKDIDICGCMRKADELMYRDKEIFYERFPDKRYR